MGGAAEMTWAGVSEAARNTMDEMGGFSPTVHPFAQEVKGYTLGKDGESVKTYWTSADLRNMAAHFIEVADWLDRRADQSSLLARSSADGLK